ncbi:MAG TPA: hypothetical protein VFI46_14925 [Jiangellaceae bacterium]|nr:hypothetical protein [Jiangellaceae bacterium]
MAATISIEQETGTSRGWVHPHNGYYAGDFARPPQPRTSNGVTSAVSRSRAYPVRLACGLLDRPTPAVRLEEPRKD